MIIEHIKILVVEDNLDHYRLIKRHIEKIVAMPEIAFVDRFEKLENYLESNTPDIIFSDYKMIGFNGLDVLKYVQVNTTISNFVFITDTVNDEELAAHTILSGATGYILKKHMNVLHTKLEPFLKEIAEKKQATQLPLEHKTIMDSVRDTVDSAKRDNKIHMDMCNEIKDSLKKLKAKQNKEML